MRFEASVFQLPKDLQAPEDYQDSWLLDPARGVAVIADGVSSGIFSGPWARLLTQAVVDRPPDPREPASFAAWLGDVRRQWSATVPSDGLSWSQRAKLRQGAFSTLLWLQLAPLQCDGSSGPADCYRLTAYAAGDSCLFHMREGRLLRSFPLDSPQQFDLDPMVLGSLDLGHDANLQWASLEDTCRLDDVLVLCTDAVARWWLTAHGTGDALDWRACRQWTPQQWQESIVRLRDQHQICDDDCTLLLLRVAACGTE